MQEAQTSAAALLFSIALTACGGLQQDVPANPRAEGVAIVEARVEDESHYVLAGQRLQEGEHFLVLGNDVSHAPTSSWATLVDGETRDCDGCTQPRQLAASNGAMDNPVFALGPLPMDADIPNFRVHDVPPYASFVDETEVPRAFVDLDGDGSYDLIWVRWCERVIPAECGQPAVCALFCSGTRDVAEDTLRARYCDHHFVPDVEDCLVEDSGVIDEAAVIR